MVTHTNDAHALDFKQVLVALVALVLVLGSASFVLYRLSEQRAQRIYSRYAQESDAYIERNRETLRELFAYDFQALDYRPSYPSPSPWPAEIGTRSQKDLVRDVIGRLDTDLEDWSSTAFVKVDAGDEVWVLKLSGDVSRIYIKQDKKEKVLELFQGKRDSIPWDDYFYEFQGKEVIVPVRDESGTVIGAILRRVVED